MYLEKLKTNSMINWPDLIFPPINLYSAPYYERIRCKGLCDNTGQYCKHCGRYTGRFNSEIEINEGEYNEKKARESNN